LVTGTRSHEFLVYAVHPLLSRGYEAYN